MISLYPIGVALRDADHLTAQPIFILASDDVPEDVVPMTTIDRCIAKAIFMLATNPDVPAVYLSADQAEKACGGGMQWSGFCEANPMIKYFVSTGHPDFRNGMAEYLRATPEIADEAANNAGKISVPAQYLIFCPTDKLESLPLEDSNVLAITFFGTAEQIRNLSALVHYRNVDIFQGVIMGVGPACSTFVSYPAGLTENAPKNAAFIGPADPTGNVWFPPDFMTMGIPIGLAQQMAADLDESFLVKRAHIAFPERRMELKYPPE